MVALCKLLSSDALYESWNDRRWWNDDGVVSHRIYGNIVILALLLLADSTHFRLLEFRTKEKASNAVRKLLDLQPRMDHVMRKQEEGKEIEIEVPIEEVHEEDIFVIRPDEMIPTDGKIIEGSSSLDESAITGESIPVDKTVGQDVICGTVNKSGLMKVIAKKLDGTQFSRK